MCDIGSSSRVVWEYSTKIGMGGKFHLKLTKNIAQRPIANKYCYVNIKRTLKRE
jgi:hypothetical protein